jgi:glyoxylase-like metal-dependent hydrolase (beta-lactamase superfamily II)
VFAPGHSPGHLAFHWPERNLLIAGDAIATWPGWSAGWPAFNLNEKQHRESLRRLAELEADIVAVGHGEPVATGGAARVRDLVDRHT